MAGGGPPVCSTHGSNGGANEEWLIQKSEAPRRKGAQIHAWHRRSERLAVE
jgi:hypothetical protein